MQLKYIYVFIDNSVIYKRFNANISRLKTIRYQNEFLFTNVYRSNLPYFTSTNRGKMITLNGKRTEIT